MTQGKPRDARKEHRWRQWIAAWQASGSSVRVFCARHGLAEPSSYAWRKKLTRRDAAAPAFVPVRVLPNEAEAEGVTIVLAGARTVRVSPGLAVLLREDHGVRVSRETVRRRLRRADLVWRRPRPLLRPQDPRRAEKLRQIRAVLRHLPADETAVFQDEVDVNTNPKVGAMGMPKGRQPEVETPRTNVRRYLAGSRHGRTGELIRSEPGTRRNADLFLAHLDGLRRRFRRYRVIHGIGDNARFHDPARCRKVWDYLLRWGHRIRLHFLPT